MTTKITINEIEAALRHVRQSAEKGNVTLFDSNSDYLRSMIEQFIEQERVELRRNAGPT